MSDIKQRLRDIQRNDGNSTVWTREVAGEAADEIERLEAELRSAEARVAKLIRDCAEADGHIAEIATERDAARAEADALRKDAERYRYWRDNHGWTGYFDDGMTNSEDADEIDAAIDAAREGGK